MKFVRFLVSGCAVAATVAPIAVARGQSGNGGAGAAPQTATYTIEQANRGAMVYRDVCSECHEALEYTGGDFRTKWNGRSLFDLVDLLRNTMPDENPGTLSRQQYSDVVAYMMKLNGVAPGKAPVPTDDEALRKVRIAIPAR
jgi:mono/diheme cytochrome c family protein